MAIPCTHDKLGRDQNTGYRCEACGALFYIPLQVVQSTLPPAVQFVEDQLAEDRRAFGNAFYRVVDGVKVRIPPEELFIDVVEPTHK